MTVEERIENLERELARAKHRNRRLTLVGIGLVGGICAVAWAVTGAESKAQTQPAGGAERVIRAHSFVVEDENGKTRGGLGGFKDGPALSLFGENGKPCAALAVNEKGSLVSLSDENGKPRAWLGAGKDGWGLYLWDENGKPRAGLHAGKDGSAALSLSDENGKLRALLSVLKDGPGLDLLDENGEPRASLRAGENGPEVYLWDEKGRRIWHAP